VGLAANAEFVVAKVYQDGSKLSLNRRVPQREIPGMRE
jgi:hypothetical protein